MVKSYENTSRSKLSVEEFLDLFAPGNYINPFKSTPLEQAKEESLTEAKETSLEESKEASLTETTRRPYENTPKSKLSFEEWLLEFGPDNLIKLSKSEPLEEVKETSLKETTRRSNLNTPKSKLTFEEWLLDFGPDNFIKPSESEPLEEVKEASLTDGAQGDTKTTLDGQGDVVQQDTKTTPDGQGEVVQQDTNVDAPGDGSVEIPSEFIVGLDSYDEFQMMFEGGNKPDKTILRLGEPVEVTVPLDAALSEPLQKSGIVPGSEVTVHSSWGTDYVHEDIKELLQKFPDEYGIGARKPYYSIVMPMLEALSPIVRSNLRIKKDLMIHAAGGCGKSLGFAVAIMNAI